MENLSLQTDLKATLGLTIRREQDPRHAARTRGINRSLAYIESNFCSQLSLGQIAKVACISRFHFARVFRDEVGMSPLEYVRWRRVKEAERRLSEGESCLLQLAAELGYFDQSHFSRCFRDVVGLTPSEYLRRTESS
jgi:AraC-like DNA-binding protein